MADVLHGGKVEFGWWSACHDGMSREINQLFELLVGETISAVDQAGNQVLLFVDAGAGHTSLQRCVIVVIKSCDNLS